MEHIDGNEHGDEHEESGTQHAEHESMRVRQLQPARRGRRRAHSKPGVPGGGEQVVPLRLASRIDQGRASTLTTDRMEAVLIVCLGG